MKTIITIEDSMSEEEVEVTYEFFGDSGKPLEEGVETSPAIDQGVAVVKFLELLMEDPEGGVSHEDVLLN